MLVQLAKENADKVRILKVDVSEHREWAVQQKVRGIPTFQIYHKGRKLEQFAGGYPKDYLQKKIDRHFDAKQEHAGDGAEVVTDGEPAGQEAIIKPMPKDWLPPGVTRQ